MQKLFIFLLSFCSFAATTTAQEIDSTTNLDINATIQSAINSANQAVAQAQDQAKRCASSGTAVSSHNIIISDTKAKGHIYNCANSDNALATFQIGNKIISNDNRIKQK